MTNIAVMNEERQLARPLKILTPLIKQDLEQGELAGMAYFEAAGAKLNEARDGHFDGDVGGFWKWACDNFGKSQTQLRDYMARARAKSNKSFKSHKNPTLRHTSGRKLEPENRSSIRRDWTAPVDQIADRARREAQRAFADDQITQRERREAAAKLGLRMIDIGYKVLAQELHPDKAGGSREAMALLNEERARLKAHV